MPTKPRRASRGRVRAVVGLVCLTSSVPAAAGAHPPSHYRDWTQTPLNAAGVAFRPYGDFFEVWGNQRGDQPYAVSAQFNYKRVRDRWKTVFQQILVGPQHFRFRRDVREHRHIFFRIIGPDGRSPIAEYRTT